MALRIHWSGTGEPLLFIPGWNTTAATVRSWLREPALEGYRCGVLEWPGLGEAVDDPLPVTLEEFLDDLHAALPHQPVMVVGFCLGGAAAWCFAQRHSGSARGAIMVDSPTHFPLILAPLLLPGLGWALLRFIKGSSPCRWLVRRAILQPQMAYPQAFLDSLFAFEVKAALHYLRLFNAFRKQLRSSGGIARSGRTCWHLRGQEVVKVLGPALGFCPSIGVTELPMEGAGHFPAVESPTVLFGCIQGILAAP